MVRNKPNNITPNPHRYVPLETAKQIVRKCWEVTPADAWFEIIPWTVKWVPCSSALSCFFRSSFSATFWSPVRCFNTLSSLLQQANSKLCISPGPCSNLPLLQQRVRFLKTFLWWVHGLLRMSLSPETLGMVRMVARCRPHAFRCKTVPKSTLHTVLHGPCSMHALKC